MIIPGMIVMAIWLFTRDGSAMSTVMLLAGLSFLALAAMLYLTSPSRSVRGEVANAMAYPGVLMVNRILSSLMIESAGIYLPDSVSGNVRLFIPLSRIRGSAIDPAGAAGPLPPEATIFSVSGPVKGVSLTPPGDGLFRYARSIGAVFREENIEGQIKDIVENGLELAPSIRLARRDDRVRVEVGGMAADGMCRRIRSEDPQACYRTGCPVCSFVACALAAGTGQKVRVASVSAENKSIVVSYELLGGANGDKRQ